MAEENNTQAPTEGAPAQESAPAQPEQNESSEQSAPEGGSEGNAE